MKIHISAGALLTFAALLMFLPLQWVVAALLAAAFHELCHLAVVYFMGGKVDEISIGGRGAVMRSAPMSPSWEFLTTIAGPIGSFSLVLLAKWMPKTAACGLIHGLFNLLPILPLDGGRILRCLLFAMIPPPFAQKTLIWFQRALYAIFGILLTIAVSRVGLIVMILAFFLLPRILFGGTIGLLSKKRYGHDRFTETNPAYRAEACPVYRR